MKPRLTLLSALITSFALLLPQPTLLASASSKKTQQPNRRLVPGEPVTTLPGTAKRWALVIGVDEYRDSQISRLKGAANDAKTLADALVRYAGFPADQVILLATDQPEERQPTRVNILRRLSNLASVVPKDGLLLVSFAGHGMERGGQAFLIPTDAQLSEDISFLEETAISVTRMKDRIRAIGVGQVLLLLDACRNDPSGRADAPNPLTEAYVKGFNFDVRNREVTAFATLYATAVGQRAYEYSEKRQGYFTWAIVQAMSGLAANSKGEVTLAALLQYVQNTVPKMVGINLGAGKQQKPFAIVDGYKADELVISVASPRTPGVATNTTKPNADTNAASEVSFWDAIKNSTDPADYEAYLEKWPDGTFATLARKRAKPSAAPQTAAKELANVTSSPARQSSLDLRDPISGEWEINALYWRTKDGQLLRRNPDTTHLKFSLDENNVVTGSATDVSGLSIPITGQWKDGRLDFTYVDPSIKSSVKAFFRLEGNKLTGEIQVQAPKGRFRISHGAKQYDLSELTIISEGLKKN